MTFNNHLKTSFKLFLTFITLSVFLSGCSLIKIESEQQPLTKQDLNIRVLTQSVVNEASGRIELAADSIIESTDNTELQINAYRWKIESLNTFKSTAFQSSPKLSLMDVWTYMVQVLKFMETADALEYYGDYATLITQTSQDNVNDIEEKARGFFTHERFMQCRVLLINMLKQIRFQKTI